MVNGANAVRQLLRNELENYITSQYFGRSPVLLSAVRPLLKQEGVLFRRPFIESSPAYQSVPNGIALSSLPQWMKQYFSALSEAGLGVHDAPFRHQIDALEAANAGKDLFVSTGTGSGKTECFMWPIMAKMAKEARQSPDSWSQRGVRTIIMYPMNALVSDQVSRLRRLIGDPEGKFLQVFRETCGASVRRPQFGMYTGRTPYPGAQPKTEEDRRLEKTLRKMAFSREGEGQDFYKKLLAEGKIPSKADMNAYLVRLHNGQHIPDAEDAELISRFEMQQFCPDILITNYSMLEYMLLRPREQKIWNETRAWLEKNPKNRLLFVIDEAHMYRGSSGGEVALLIRRLFSKLGIQRERVQFILTTASMPDNNKEGRNAIDAFADALTAADGKGVFCYLTGEQEDIRGKVKYNIPSERFISHDAAEFEKDDETRLKALNGFWNDVEGCPAPFPTGEQAAEWMYDHLSEYRQFNKMMEQCRGSAISLQELAETIFPDESEAQALNMASVLLAIAPIARNKKGAVLFPARMHMLFKGIKGVYACANRDCPHSHTDGSLTLGKVFLSDGRLTCPECGSVVYELFNDRRCGALFYRGYILKETSFSRGGTYLWHYPGQLMDKRLKEIHLYIPENRDQTPKGTGKNQIRPCYLDIKSGFVFFDDDAMDGKSGFRKLYYCDYCENGRPQVITFPTCPHCLYKLPPTQMSSFSTRGNQSFFNLIQTQFLSQPPVPGKEGQPNRIPNEGRKVLLFSDSRQRAAKLARDMSDASEIMAARQLFALAIEMMGHSREEQSMDKLYDYFCLAAGKNDVYMYHDSQDRKERTNFVEHCHTVLDNYRRRVRRNKEYSSRFSITNAPTKMQEQLLRLFSGGYNTLYDAAVCWIEPTEKALEDLSDWLYDDGIDASDDEIRAFFHAWLIAICDSDTALGHTISDDVRREVRKSYSGYYGLQNSWDFPQTIYKVMGWKKGASEALTWRRVLQKAFLVPAQPDNGRFYVDLTRVKPQMSPDHVWYCCERCSDLTPFLLRTKCPHCGHDKIHALTESELNALSFWRKPIEDAMRGERVRVIDTEEHTAQLSHKDQRDELWSKTESYELRFQDMIQDNESPVDILSSTTTMEVGIDIGSLVAVGLRNIPPMRENYQQRAGRAGRRGSSLSTIVTFCEDGPHDTLYFKNPIPMFRGDPRKPWIDITSTKLLQRHTAMVVLQAFLETKKESLDDIPAVAFLDNYMAEFELFLKSYSIESNSMLIPDGVEFLSSEFQSSLLKELDCLKEKRERHPELYGAGEDGQMIRPKSLLDALYEEGTIPTYSFPKNVVSIYISDRNGRLNYQVERGLDVAIGEYAPGRAVVVDKTTYQIGGLFVPGSEWGRGQMLTPAKKFLEDPNYLKKVLSCERCGWFGLSEEKVDCCPFCGNQHLSVSRQMLRPWGFAPRNGTDIPNAQLTEEYSAVQQPLYSTLPDSETMVQLGNAKNIRMACRSNQRIIMLNKGTNDRGFVVCEDCGAAFPGDDAHVLDKLQRPYYAKGLRSKCRHSNVVNVNLGYDFITDMLVLEFELAEGVIETDRQTNPWVERAAQSLSEALRLVASQTLDIEFTELVTGYRLRKNRRGTFIDIYLYDSLSSGAGYAVSLSMEAEMLLEKADQLLSDCTCDSACHKCLKHYRNQFIHGLLDRFAARDLLRWGIYGELPELLSAEAQRKMLLPLDSILAVSGYRLALEAEQILINGKGVRKKLVVYPAMRKEPVQEGTIFVSDAFIKYAKPYAVQKIIDSVKRRETI